MNCTHEMMLHPARNPTKYRSHSSLRIISFNLCHKNSHMVTNNYLAYGAERRAESRNQKSARVTRRYWRFRRVRHCVPRVTSHAHGDPKLT